MTKRTTIRDIAREAGVSDTAVSLALQMKSRISAGTRQRILEIAKRLNYSPNRAARNLRYGKSRTIGFVVTDITNPFYARMIRSSEKIALDFGYNVLFGESSWDPDKEVQIVSNMIESRVQGMLMCFCERTLDSLGLIQHAKLPLIAVDTHPSKYKGAYVANDLAGAGYLAAQHLIDVGRRIPMFFTASAPLHRFSAFRLLRKGFSSCLKANNVPFPDSAVIDANLTVVGGARGFATLLSTKQRFDSIFCPNDLCALGVIDAAEQHGYRVGQDIAVIGIDNLEISGVSRISLTSIDQPYDRVIELATRSLIANIESAQPLTIRRKCRPSLIVRASTGLQQRCTAGDSSTQCTQC